MKEQEQPGSPCFDGADAYEAYLKRILVNTGGLMVLSKILDMHQTALEQLAKRITKIEGREKNRERA